MIIEEPEVILTAPEKPVVKEKWRKRTANFLMKVYDKEKEEFDNKIGINSSIAASRANTAATNQSQLNLTQA